MFNHAYSKEISNKGPSGDYHARLCARFSTPVPFDFSLFGEVQAHDTYKSARATGSTEVKKGTLSDVCVVNQKIGTINNEGYFDVKFVSSRNGTPFDTKTARINVDSTGKTNEWTLSGATCSPLDGPGIYMVYNGQKYCNGPTIDVDDPEYVELSYGPTFPSPKCNVNYSSLNFDHGSVKIGAKPTDSTPQTLSVICDMDTSLNISMKTPEIDMGNGVKSQVCIYQASCFTVSNSSYHITAKEGNTLININTQIITTPSVPGDYSGNSVMLIEYE
jgi:hypothetical protein